MRKKVTKKSLSELMNSLAMKTQGPGCIFFAGGATALMLGLREQTIDVDLK
jgi:hypothetical protein